MRRQLGDDEELITDLIALFLVDYPGRLQTLNAAFDARDADAVGAVAHTLKGGVSSFCAGRAADAARVLEELTSAEDFAAIGKQVERLVAEIEHLAAALRELQAGQLAERAQNS